MLRREPLDRVVVYPYAGDAVRRHDDERSDGEEERLRQTVRRPSRPAQEAGQRPPGLAPGAAPPSAPTGQEGTGTELAATSLFGTQGDWRPSLFVSDVPEVAYFAGAETEEPTAGEGNAPQLFAPAGNSG